jgi:hypothetical protein
MKRSLSTQNLHIEREAILLCLSEDFLRILKVNLVPQFLVQGEIVQNLLEAS